MFTCDRRCIPMVHLYANNNIDVSSVVNLMSPTVDVDCDLHSLQKTKNAN